MSRLMLNWPASYKRLATEVTEKGAAVVPSVNHTGTWFVLGFLSEHPSCYEAVDIASVLARNSVNVGAAIHFHVGGSPQLWDAYDGLMETGRVIIPLRDPMLCLCTRQQRHPFLDHNYIVEGFKRLAETKDATFFPVDTDPSQRSDILCRVLTALDWPIDPAYVDFWARTWARRNTVGENTSEKNLYRDGDYGLLRKRLTPEFDNLLAARDTLVPFLKEQGYKELSWWNL